MIAVAYAGAIAIDSILFPRKGSTKTIKLTLNSNSFYIMAIQHTLTDWITNSDRSDGLNQIKTKDGLFTIATVHGFQYNQGKRLTGEQAQANAALICDAVNNTAGAGIDPNAVPRLLGALKNILGLVISLKLLGLSSGCEDEIIQAIGESTKAIKATQLK